MSGKFSDQFLIASSIAGDEQAFGTLYDKYVEDIYRFVVMRVRNTHEAQDVTAEVFLKAWQYVSVQKKYIKDFRALLYRIARNVVIDHYRSSQKEVAAFDEDGLESVEDMSSNIVENIQHNDDMRLVFQVLDQLSDDHRELIILRYVQDLSIKEIAEAQGKTNGAIRVALHRAVKQIKTLIPEA
ncbi:MAG: RNA polymerase sigma factor [Parcubacteria group bacterium]|nr:RNA polymerase sigma factor [Parcubacteria group bacterium]